MNLINFIIFVTMLNTVFYNIYASNINRVKNNMLRIYVFSSPRPLRKGILKKMKHFFTKSYDKVYICLYDVNSSYYSLSEEDRLIIETIISLTY